MTFFAAVTSIYNQLNYYVHCKSLLKVHFLIETVVLSDFVFRSYILFYITHLLTY